MIAGLAGPAWSWFLGLARCVFSAALTPVARNRRYQVPAGQPQKANRDDRHDDRRDEIAAAPAIDEEERQAGYAYEGIDTAPG
jgi:hypothetical protein